MKHWFCGFVTQDNNSLTKLPKPLSGKLLWRGKNYLWICGNWKKEQVITVSEYLTQMAIVGSCLASHETVIKLFQKAVKEGEYSQLMKLPGNYNLIIQDNIDTYIFVDAAGIKSAFYAVYNSVIVYSSLGIAIQELLKSELDQSWLATFLTGMGTLSLVQKRTPFCDVQPIPAGYYLHISSGKLTCNRYWYKPQEYKAFPDAAQDLREQLLTAVEGRVYLYGNISSDLSGGFDSTTLALIAARYLASQDNQLMTITEKTFSATQSSDVKYAQQAASLYPNINAVMIEEHELPSEYSGLESVPLIDAPDPLVLDMTRTNYVMKVIKSTGSQLHLNGEGGDVVLSSTYCYCANLLKRVQIVTFLQHIYGWSRLENCSTFSLIRDFINLSFGSYRSWLFQEIKKIQVNKYLHKTTNNLFTTEQVIGWDSIPEFMSWHTNKVVDIVLEELYKWVIIAAPFADTPGEHQTIADIQSMGFTIKAEQQIADIYDIILESPYLDSLVINACLYAKPEERTSPFAYKPLLIKAFQKDFPQNIFIRNTKGDYTADEFADLRKNRTIIKEVLNTSILADMGLIDINKIQTATQSFSMGFLAGLPLFNHTLALEIWLRSFVQKKNSFWLQED